MELGDESLAEHQALFNLLISYNWKAVVLVGGDFEKVEHHLPLFYQMQQRQKTGSNQQHFEHTSYAGKRLPKHANGKST